MKAKILVFEQKETAPTPTSCVELNTIIQVKATMPITDQT